MSSSPASSDSRFSDFVLLQAQNAGLFLGKLPNPITGKPQVNLKAARSVLDSLEMLQVKCAGNLSDKEEQLLDKALVNLRELYDEVEANAQEL